MILVKKSNDLTDRRWGIQRGGEVEEGKESTNSLGRESGILKIDGLRNSA